MRLLPAVTRRNVLATLLSVAAIDPPLVIREGALLPPAAEAAGAPQALGALTTYVLKGAALDPRSYRGLVLANGLRVLLTSDPTAASGAASMNVQVGTLSDPKELPGLAHFCEHMLFLGTKKFPDEGDFERFVGSAGGSNNAYTAEEETNYFFDVNADALPKALEIFAGFFTSPLFTESATAREVNAIDSEHSKNLQNDYWRYSQLLKTRCDPQHPYSKFGTGNRQTLNGGDAAARAALLEFHSQYYLADQMALTIVGPQGLDTLQALAVTNFGAVPASPSPPAPLLAPSIASQEYDDLPLPFRPSEAPPFATLMVPVNDVRLLKFVWCVPVQNLGEWVASKPDEVWSLLLRNRADGGLLPLLKRRGLATSLDASVDEFTRSFVLLSFVVDLTPEGLAKWRDVGALVFAYLRQLASSGLPAYIVDEFRTLTKIGYEYAEPRPPQDYATSSSPLLAYFAPEDWVTGPATVAPGSQRGCQAMLDFCKQPTNAMITLEAKTNERVAKETEPIYGTKYAKLPLDKEVKAWASSPIPPELALPARNTYIPTEAELAIKCGAKSCAAPKPEAVAPRLLVDDAGTRVHLLQDATFRRPKAFAFFLFRSDLLSTSPKASVTAELFQAIFADVLQDQTYQAALAGLGTSLAAEYNGLFLTAQGYSARMPELIEYVSGQVRTAELTSLAFGRQREALRQTLSNFDRKQPVSLCSYRRNLALERPRYTIPELLEAVEKITLADVVAFQRALLPETYLETFVAGNVDQGDAARMLGAVTKGIPSRGALDSARIPRRQVRILPPGRLLQQFVAPNPNEQNSATEVYLQIGMDTGDNWLLLQVVSQLISQPFYGELRTKQQLGYIVQSAVSGSEGVRALVFSVQSSVLPPPEVEKRIDTFLADYRGALANLPDAELATVKESLASQFVDVDKRLGAQASRFWGEIVQRRYDYGRPWRNAARVRRVTKQQVLDFYDAYIAPAGSPQMRRLTTQVFAKAAAPSKLVTQMPADEFYPRPPEKSPPSADRMV